MTLTDQLIDAIQGSGATLYRVAKDSGIACAVLQRFVTRERGITLETADKLAAYFRMKLSKPKWVSPT